MSTSLINAEEALPVLAGSNDDAGVLQSGHGRKTRFAIGAAVAIVLLGLCAIGEGCNEKETSSAGETEGVEATLQGSCKLPKDFCKTDPGREDKLSYRDCDGDGILDPYCEGGELLRFGYVSSKNNCQNNWPSGICVREVEPSDEQGEFDVKKAAGNEITVIHFNDVYQVSGVLANGIRRGGMSRAAHVINQERKRNPDRTFVVFAGDALSPSVLSDLFDGEQMVDILNELKLDAASLGNHEFDFGVDTLGKRIGESKFPWLNINLLGANGELLNGTQKRLTKTIPFIPPWSSEESSTKVCVFGSAYDVRETMFKDKQKIGYKDKLQSAKDEIQHLRDNEGCKVILGMTHQFSSSDCELSKHAGKDLDLILGAHDHSTEMTTVCGHAPYVKADSDLKTQWIMTLWLDEKGEVESVDGRLLSLTDSDPFDEEVHEKIVNWEVKGEQQMNVVLGCSDVEMDMKDAHSRQELTNGAVFFTDAVKEFHHTDVAIINGGTIRANKMFEKGNLTKKIITEMHPFGNSIVKIYATGGDIRKYLNQQLSCWEKVCGNFCQVAGLTYTFNPDLDASKRLVDLKYANGTAVGDADVMTVALSDYMLANSDLKHNKLFEMTTLNDAVPIVTALFDYTKKTYADGNKCLNPKKDGRIKKVS